MDQDLTQDTATQDRRIPMPNSKFVYATQIFFRVLVYPIHWCLARRVIIDLQADQIEPNVRYMLVPNHGSFLDPLVIMHHIPSSSFRILGPIRVMVLNKLLSSFIKPFILALGSFPAKPHPRYRSGIEMAQYFLDNGALLAIFPEGKRNFDGTAKPRRGVADLADHDDVRIIPVHVEWRRHFHGYIPTYKLHMGSPVLVAGKSAEEIMEIIYSLSL